MIQKWIEVTEQNQRNFGLLADAFAKLKNLLKSHSVMERPLRRALYHRTIRDGIGKRHAELNQIRARFLQSKDEVEGYFYTRIPRCDVRNERLAAFGFELGEFLFNASHCESSPINRITSVTSL